MEARNVKHVVVAVGAIFLCAAPAGYAAMFKWTDANGTVTYSDQPPADRAKVHRVAQLDIGNAESNAATAPHSPQEPSLSRPDTWLKGASPPAPPVERKIELVPSAKADTEPLSPDADIPNREGESASRAPRGAREAARDPCLRSSDPKCYERNKARYHPYLGYAPEGASAIGATGSTVAGGAVGAHVPTPSANAAPRKVETPLIFMDQPQEKKRSSRWPFGTSR
jgi:hypothetical protein